MAHLKLDDFKRFSSIESCLIENSEDVLQQLSMNWAEIIIGDRLEKTFDLCFGRWDLLSLLYFYTNRALNYIIIVINRSQTRQNQ